MSIKEEFEKEFNEWLMKRGETFPSDSALWAAKWMAERCARVAQGRGPMEGDFIASEIRQLAKEMGGE